MAEGRITPEKELLNLIEGSKQNDNSGIQKAAFKRNVNSFFSFGAFIGRLSFFNNWLKNGVKGAKFYVDIKTLNKILGFCILILAAYFMINLLNSIINSKKLLNLESKISKGGLPPSLPEVSSLRPASYYLEKVKSRNIFSMAADIIAKESETKAIRAKITELAGGLKLVGISWSNDPDIIVEDTKAQQAYFLKKGQKIKDFVIKEVYKDKIVLTYGGEEIELR